MLQIASDITIRLDELTEEYVKIRQIKDETGIIIVEVNGQKAMINYTEMINALEKLNTLNIL